MSELYKWGAIGLTVVFSIAFITSCTKKTSEDDLKLQQSYVEKGFTPKEIKCVNNMGSTERERTEYCIKERQ